MYPECELKPVRDIEFGKNRAQMGFDGSLRNLALHRNSLVGRPIRCKNGYFYLAGRQSISPCHVRGRGFRDQAIHAMQQSLHEALSNPDLACFDDIADLLERCGVGECVAVGHTSGIQGQHRIVVVRVGTGRNHSHVVTLQNRGPRFGLPIWARGQRQIQPHDTGRRGPVPEKLFHMTDYDRLSSPINRLPVRAQALIMGDKKRVGSLLHRSVNAFALARKMGFIK